MYHPYTVALFGHRQLDHALQVEQRLEEALRELQRTHAQVDFLLGRNGEFDLLAASVIRRVRRDFGERSATLTLILPYLTAQYRDNEAEFLRYYDAVEVCPAPHSLPPKARIPLRNRMMVEQADAVICCVEHPRGGAYEAALYARELGREILSLGAPTCI